MSIRSVTRRAQRRAPQISHLDACTVERIVGEATNDETGEVEPLLEIVYSGPCKLQNQSQYEMGAEAGGHVSVEQRSLVHFPVGSFQVRHGDLCTFTASVAPGVAGQKYRLQGETPYRSFESAYRVYAVQEVA